MNWIKMGERLKKVSPRLYRANVNDFFFGKTGGYVQVGMVLACRLTRVENKYEKLHERC